MGELRVDGKPGTLAVPAALDGACAAGTGSRVAAQAIEGGLLALFYIIVNASVIGSLSDPYSNSGGAIGFVLLLGFAVSVGELFLILTRGQTYGRLIMGLRIVKFEDGQQGGGSFFLKLLLEGALSGFTLGIGLLFVFFTTQDEANRHWADRTCGVITIDTRKGRDTAATASASTTPSYSGPPTGTGRDQADGLSDGPNPAASALPGLNGSGTPSTPPPPPPAFAAATMPPPPPPAPLASSDVAAIPAPVEVPASAVAAPASSDGFIDEVPWKKAPSGPAAPPPPVAILQPSPAMPPAPADPVGESDLDKTVVSPKNVPLKLTFDDGNTHLLEGETVIGRDPLPDANHERARSLQIVDPAMSVSKTHMALSLKAGAVLVEDLYSTNGTWVVTPDGTTSAVLPGVPLLATPGSTIHFGDRSMRVSG